MSKQGGWRGERVSSWSEQGHVPNTGGRKNCGGLRSHRIPSLCGVLNQATAHPFVCQGGDFSLLQKFTKYSTASFHGKGEGGGH